MGEENWPRKVKVGNSVISIYRAKHPTYASGYRFRVAWTEAGRQRFESRASEEEALELARTKAGQLNQGQVEVASMSAKDRDELQAIREVCKGIPPMVAIREWRLAHDKTSGYVVAAAEAWAARNLTACKKITVAEAVNAFMVAKEKAGVDVSCSYQKILPTLRTAFADRPLDNLSGRELQDWMHERYPHPVTFNTARKRFVTLWRWCRKQGYLPRDAQTEAEVLDSAQEEDTAIGVINSATFEALLKLIHEKHPEYLAALVVAGFAGLRRSEIHDQTWQDIVLGRKFLRVTKAKRNTPSRRLVPLGNVALKWLKLCKDRQGAICDNLAMDRIREIGRHAGFDLPENCFRHSFISHEVARSGNVAETALAAGNSPAIIFKHYRELFTKKEGKAWFEVMPPK